MGHGCGWEAVCHCRLIADMICIDDCRFLDRACVNCFSEFVALVEEIIVVMLLIAIRAYMDTQVFIGVRGVVHGDFNARAGWILAIANENL